MNPDDITVLSPEVVTFLNDKEDGFRYRERRQDQWTENYTLYRDTVVYNRLTQRQSVHVPLMKMSLKTLLAQYDDMPVVFLENLDNDKEAEVFLNEYWKLTGERNNFEILDIVDKRQEQFFGRSFNQWQIIDGSPKMTIISPEDILVSRFTDPTNIHSSRFLIHTHIFVPLSVLEQNENYDKKALKALRDWFATSQGLEQATENEESFLKKQQKLIDLGLDDALSPTLGETIIEISLHFRFTTSRDGKGQEIYLRVIGQDMQVLMGKPLEEVIGVTVDNYWQNHYPYNSWAGDIDMQDFWTDGVADIVRGSNKVLDTFYSQKVENRTMRNMGMNYYNGAADGAENWAPQTFEPKAFGWYKVPGPPNELIQRVEIPDLNDVQNDMQFIMDINERATGATSTQQGVETERKVTLGEVELALGQAQERIKGMAKYYNKVWFERAEMFLKLVEAGSDKLDAVKVYKEGINSGKLFMREIEPGDWKSEEGYRVKLWSKAERDALNTASLEKWSAIKTNMPDNPKVDDLFKRKLLEFGEATPDETTAIMEYEEQKRQAMIAQAQMEQQMLMGAGVGMGGQAPGMSPGMVAPGAGAMPPSPPPLDNPKPEVDKKKVDKLKMIRDKIPA